MFTNNQTSEFKESDPTPFLKSLNLKHLTAEQKEQPRNDIRLFVRKFPFKKKAPGMDGILIDLSQHFGQVLSPFLWK